MDGLAISIRFPSGYPPRHGQRRLFPTGAFCAPAGRGIGAWSADRNAPRKLATAAGQSAFVLVERGDEPIALANVRIKRIPVIATGLALISQGPVMLQPGAETHRDALAALRQHVVEKLGQTLRINPPVEPEGADARFDGEGFRSVAGSGYETFLVDLRPGLDLLRKNLDGKWRTDLNRGERAGVTITRSSHPDDFTAFQPLLDQLAAGKSFKVPQDAEFFARVAAMAQQPERIVIHLARRDGRVIGGHVGAFSGDMAVYLLGATNEEGRDHRASFLLQWAVIEYAKQLGMSWYDLGGADEQTNPSVFRFKQRMGGKHYIGPPMIEAAARWPRGQIVSLAEKAYARVKG
jgi:hypothetical protein